MRDLKLDGSLVGQFISDTVRIDEFLGAGGMGIAYRGHQTDLDRDLCIKFLRPELLSDSTTFERFKREMNALAKLSHPNIVQSYFHGKLGNIYPYYAMEFVRGTSLREILEKKGSLPWRQACALLSEVCEAMHYAHERGFVHRDLKPDNIMLNENGGKVKILDFGLVAVINDRTATITKTGLAVGSIPYMAPEVVMGVSTRKGLNRATDIYALGCILYELITGFAPFSGTSPIETMKRHCNEDLPNLSQETAPAPVRTQLDDIIANATRKNRDLRTSNCEKLRDALQEALCQKDSGNSESYARSYPTKFGSRTKTISATRLLIITSLALALLALCMPGSTAKLGARMLIAREWLTGNDLSRERTLAFLLTQGQPAEAASLFSASFYPPWAQPTGIPQFTGAQVILNFNKSKRSSSTDKKYPLDPWQPALGLLADGAPKLQTSADIEQLRQLTDITLAQMYESFNAELAASRSPYLNSAITAKQLDTLARTFAKLKDTQRTNLLEGACVDALIANRRYAEAKSILATRTGMPQSYPEGAGVQSPEQQLCCWIVDSATKTDKKDKPYYLNRAKYLLPLISQQSSAGEIITNFLIIASERSSFIDDRNGSLFKFIDANFNKLRDRMSNGFFAAEGILIVEDRSGNKHETELARSLYSRIEFNGTIPSLDGPIKTMIKFGLAKRAMAIVNQVATKVENNWGTTDESSARLLIYKIRIHAALGEYDIAWAELQQFTNTASRMADSGSHDGSTLFDTYRPELIDLAQTSIAEHYIRLNDKKRLNNILRWVQNQLPMLRGSNDDNEGKYALFVARCLNAESNINASIEANKLADYAALSDMTMQNSQDYMRIYLLWKQHQKGHNERQ